METLFDDEKRLLAIARFEHDKSLLDLDITPELCAEDHLNLLPMVRKILNKNTWINEVLITCLNDQKFQCMEQVSYQYKLWERMALAYGVHVAIHTFQPNFKTNEDRIRVFGSRADARKWLLDKSNKSPYFDRRVW